MDPNTAKQTSPPVMPLIDSNPSISTMPPSIPSVPFMPATPDKPNHKKRNILLIAIILLLLSGGAFLFAYYYSLKNVPSSFVETPIENNSNQALIMRQWVDCSSSGNQVWQEGGKLYVGCLGGVVVIDESSKKIVDQFTRTDGLTDYSVTSLVKKDNILYVGTQNGVSIINLQTRNITPLTTKEGLVSGSNINLKLDGEWLWIATFNGVARYNTVSKKLENISEIKDYDAKDIVVTPKSIYIVGHYVVNKAVAQSAVMIFDKTNNSWKTIKASEFENYSPNAQIFQGIYFDGQVYVGDGTEFWKASDDGNQIFKKTILVSNQKSNIDFLGTNENYIFMYDRGEEKILTLDNKSQIANYYPGEEFTEGHNLVSQSSVANLQNGKIWILPYRGFDQKNIDFIRSFDITSKKFNSINLADSDIYEIAKLFGSINGKALALTRFQKIILVDAQTGTSESIANLSGQLIWPDSVSSFLPIEGSSKVLIFGQGCGQGCAQPHFYILDFSTKFIKEIEISKEVLSSFEIPNSGLQSFDSFKFSGYKKDSTDFYFESTSPDRPFILLVNSNTLAISKIDQKPENLYMDAAWCNKDYTFINNKFDANPECTSTYEVKTQYGTWMVDESFKLKKITNEGVETEVVLQETEPRYSPWDWTMEGQQTVKGLTYKGNYLYVNTDLGLIKINVTNDEQTLISTKDGLLVNDTKLTIVTNKGIWVSADDIGGQSYGLSFIPNK